MTGSMTNRDIAAILEAEARRHEFLATAFSEEEIIAGHERVGCALREAAAVVLWYGKQNPGQVFCPQSRETAAKRA